MGGSLRSIIGRVSPRRRRWETFLAGLPLDPDRLDVPLPEPSTRDFIICGASRSGTTLLAGALHQPPQVVTVVEPWDGMRLPPEELFASLRREIDSGHALSRGKLDLGRLRSSGAIRWQPEGSQTVELDVVDDFLLGIKWPNYWRFLDHLRSTKFLVCVRDPVEVVESYERVGGRLGLGLDYDTAFNRSMNAQLQEATDDEALRRVLLYEYVNSRILPHMGRPNVLVVRYERWFDDPEGLVGELSDFLGVELGSVPVRISEPSSRRQVGDRPDLEALIESRAPSAAALGYPV